jgi:iron complex outermembrane receptor protein
MKRTSLSLMITACFIANAAAQETKTLSPVVVTATRVEQDSFDLPMSIDKVEKDTIQNGGVKMTLSESLARVPGITAQNRNQMAQDPQISSRGFGARSSFGVRGIRIYVDGIPLSMPDGIGNPGSVDLGAMSSIEVMRGPFSAMYGNSSGGVIQMFTDKAPATPEVSGDILFGSFNTRRESVQATGTKNGVEYLVNYSDYNSDGYRQQSANDKRQATAKLGIKIAEDTKLTMLTSWFDQFAQDPGGLINGAKTTPSANNPSAFAGSFFDPTGVAVGARAQNGNTRVYRSNTQVGFNLEHKIDNHNLINMIIYGGERENLQYLVTSSTTPFGGRASSISRKFSGAEVRVTNNGQLLEKPYSVSYGVNAGFMRDARLDRPTELGIILPSGTPNRNESQRAQNFDQYVQGLWSFADKWDLHAGIRHTALKINILDKLPTNADGDGSGGLNFAKTVPVAGIIFKPNSLANFYANFGKGFETPTLIEVTYSNPDTLAGPNYSLKPSTSTNIEIGSKIFLSDTTRINVAAFDIKTQNEIVVNQQKGTTASYNNAGTTSRNGLEASIEKELQNNFKAYLAYTLLNAKFDDTFTYQTISTITGLTSNRTVNSGNYIPGTYKSQIYGEVSWKYNPWNLNTAIEGRYNSKVFVDDLNTDIAPSYLIFSTRASIQQKHGNWKFTEYARIDNIFDESYIGSVRVNDANSRFFEPAPGRNWIMGVKANYLF